MSVNALNAQIFKNGNSYKWEMPYNVCQIKITLYNTEKNCYVLITLHLSDFEFKKKNNTQPTAFSEDTEITRGHHAHPKNKNKMDKVQNHIHFFLPII